MMSWNTRAVSILAIGTLFYVLTGTLTIEAQTQPIDAATLHRIAESWHQDAGGDLNGDGVTNWRDLMTASGYWQQAIPQESTATPTQTPSSTPTLTPTLTSTETATPTESPTTTTTPTSEITSTPTETASVTPTSTLTETPVPTPTSTFTQPPVPTPTSTFTQPPVPTPTSTSTSTVTPSSTPTVTATSSATSTVTSTPSETATQGPEPFQEININFDSSSEFPDKVQTLVPSSELTREQVLEQIGDYIPGYAGVIERIPFDYEPAFNLHGFLPWTIRSVNDAHGRAASAPHAAAIFGSEDGEYDIDRTSILRLGPFDTTQASLPRMSLAVAYQIENAPQFGFQLYDCLTFEVSTDGGKTFQLLDVNGGGVEPSYLRPGFDAFYSVSPGFDAGAFVTVDVTLPKSSDLILDLKFFADNFNEFGIPLAGPFVDDIRIYDGFTPPDPVLASAVTVNGVPHVADLIIRYELSGTNLTPVKSVTLSQGTAVVTAAIISAADNRVVIEVPPLPNPDSSGPSIITLTRNDGKQTTVAGAEINAAPVPAANSFTPQPFYRLDDVNQGIIEGQNYRLPVDDGQGSAVLVHQIGEGGINETLTFQNGGLSLIDSSRTVLALDLARLRSRLLVGTLTLQVINQVSGKTSNSLSVTVLDGSGPLRIDSLVISGYPEITERQLDQELQYEFTGDGFRADDLLIVAGGIELVTNSVSRFPGQVDLNVLTSERLTLDIAPGIMTIAGDLPLVIQAATQTAQSSIRLVTPEPPVLDDTRNYLTDTAFRVVTIFQEGQEVTARTISNASNAVITIRGDNFRGIGRETPSQVSLVMVDNEGTIISEVPISVGAGSLFISPPRLGEVQPIVEALDIFGQLTIPAGSFTVSEGEQLTYHVKVSNPDSGLSTISMLEDELVIVIP